MGTQNYLWHFILSVLLCTLMALEGRDTTTATAESHLIVLRSTNNSSTTGPAANSSDGSVAEPDTSTAHSLLGTALLSPSSMSIMGTEGTMSTTPTTKMQERGSLGVSAKNSAFPTAGTGTTTAPSMGTETGTASSPPLSSATRSHFSSSSPKGSSPVPPSPQQSSTSSTTGMPSATTSHPATALVFSPSSSAGIAQFSAGTETQGPATPRPVASTSPASATIEARPSPTAGSSTGTPTPQLSSTALPQGQPPVQVTATSPPGEPLTGRPPHLTGSPSPSTATASAGSRATTPPGEGETSTMNQGIRTTTETSHSLPATSLASTMTTVGGEGRMDTAPTTIMSERASPATSPRSAAVSPAFPTAGTGTTTAPESGTASSLSFSSTVMSHSSSSSSPEGSPALPPSPQQSSTSSTTGMPSATTSHAPTALVFSTARVTDVGSDTVTAEQVTRSPAPSTASTNPVAPASETAAPSHSPTAGSSTGTPTPQLSSTALPQGQPPVQVTATSPPTGSPSPSTATASAGSRATTPPGGGETSTMNQGDRTTEPTANTSHSLPTTSLATPSMTNLSTSTSVNPSFTTTCSPITLSIQLQKVTSRTIQFSWKPQGGRADSPYTVRLLGELGEEEERVLNETSTAFENLLSARQYQISVNVLTCSKNVSTSLTVQTEHTTTVSPKTNTTGFTGTASNSIFTTTFTSAPCRTVSIEVQNVTGEEIELSWSSSSKGSLYNISVRDGKEIHTRTTNETEAVIKDLLPGHVYTISVALSSCAENNPASVTVRTDSGSCFRRTEFCLAQSTGCSDLKGIVCSNNEAFACRVWLKNQIFNNTLYNSDSESYVTLSESLRAEVVEAMHAELGNAHSDILVLGLRPGSVIADFLFLLPKEEARDVGDIQTRLSNVLRSKFGSQSEVQTLSVQSSTDNSSSWRVAVIVLGVLLGVALVLILLAILFYIHVRRRSATGQPGNFLPSNGTSVLSSSRAFFPST
ncbi:mucin-2-like isoform X2 [Haemorhous mexicanus]|uniref:mucin-2-like isoform X2 n=1 Tax=Haemorhous mexicanus TaxID=30427 RepID=UPI0028BE8237|nr:mucin-2-like isoform X2 [Haemorhous mexicanus]